MIGFALLTVYMLFAAIFLAVKGIEAVKAVDDINAGTIFGNKIFRNIVVSLVATYGLYIIASLLALDPWHMRTFDHAVPAPKLILRSHEFRPIPLGRLGETGIGDIS